MKLFHTSLLGLALLTATASNVFAADTYVIDPVHSTIGFTVKHLTVSEVEGKFKTFSGSVTLDAANSSFDATIDVKSINTENEGRDKHLLNPDFFDADNPANATITFKSTAVSVLNNVYTVKGNLTMKGVTKEITIPLTVSGPVKHPMSGGDVIGLTGQTTINRQDFGVKWNKQMDQGGWMVSDDVTLIVKLEAAKK